MSHQFRRLYSTATCTAQEIASQFLQRAQSLPPQTLTQILDLNQLQRLACTLDRPIPSASLPSSSLSPSHASANTNPISLPQPAIPATHHLVYFTPCLSSSHLGPDGSDMSHNPPEPFTRRMWAGGEVVWRGRENLLRVGQTVTETTRVNSVEAKRSGSEGGGEMIIVGVEKELRNQEGWAVRDRRNWIFRPALPSSSSSTSAFKPSPSNRLLNLPFPSGTHTKDIIQTLSTLFRFSALTFNAHKIHYSQQWSREVEGQRDCVVHGPLNLMLVVDFWRDVMMTRTMMRTAGLSGDDSAGARAHAELVPKRVEYRAMSPVFVDEAYRIIMDEESADGISDVRIVNGIGVVCMRARIERFLDG